MKLIEALKILRAAPPEGTREFRVLLACGFTPLHLDTFLKAHLQRARPADRVSSELGVFGDLAGTLEAAAAGDADSIAIAIEWDDLDPRLGVRSLGGWKSDTLAEIVELVGMSLSRLAAAITALAVPTAVALPSLELAPACHTAAREAGTFELQLRAAVADFAVALTANRHVHVVSSQRLDRCSPAVGRFALDSALATGFPYKRDHAQHLAACLASLLSSPFPKRGIITDLDDTLWSGILGEVGVAGVAWNLDGKAQIHGLYQQILSSLGSAGVLVAVASKNTRSLVDEAFERTDLVLTRDEVYPIEAHWQAKSDSVARIIDAWNVGADSVVFIDDSPMEVAEVQAAFPEVECIVFPKSDPHAFWELLFHLRDVFGKHRVSDEDSLRLASLRAGHAFRGHDAEGAAATADAFLERAAAKISFNFSDDGNERAFELINKTNQFNLNGRRLTESGWSSVLDDPSRFVLKVSYEDRFGRLGIIAVVVGTRTQAGLSIERWVMSCRAFSRRIEHRCLECLFDHYGVDNVAVQFAPTPRNRPTQEFLSTFSEPLSEGLVAIPRSVFVAACPPLYHRTEKTPSL